MLKTPSNFSTIRTPSSYPASRKRYFEDGHEGLRVPYREIALSATQHSGFIEENPPLPVYDTSGAYTDPDVRIDLAHGLPALRADWITQRNDTKILGIPSSEYARRRERDLLTYHLRFPSPFMYRRANEGRNVTQMHYARKGIVTPEMEFVALRESMILTTTMNIYVKTVSADAAKAMRTLETMCATTVQPERLGSTRIM